MTIEQANEYFSSLPEGFAPAEELSAALTADARKVQFVGVAGTAGKTAAAGLLTAILREAAFHTGFYRAGCEPLSARIAIGGVSVDPVLFCQAAEALSAAKPLPRAAAELAAAACCFGAAGCKLAVVELPDAGLAAALPSMPVCAVTAIGPDGVSRSVERLAALSAGVMRKGAVCVTAPEQPKAVLSELVVAAAKAECELVVPDAEDITFLEAEKFTSRVDYGGYTAPLAFLGRHAAGNAAVAVAVVLLGFGMNLGVILQTGKQSLPIIICTISTSLIIAWLLRRIINVPSNTAILVGVGSSICGGSAIAATAPVIDADDTEVAQAISVIFFFNVIAAVLFPVLGHVLGFDTTSGSSFGLFAGTAINDTSSVTAAASTWDSMWNLGNETLNNAVTVKLTRTLAIIPITLVLSLIHAKSASVNGEKTGNFSIKRAFPMFILYFIIAAIITTACMSMGISADVFAPLKELSKFFIIMAMAAIGLNSNVIKLIKSGGKPLLLGASCWIGITIVSLTMQHIMHLW